MYRIAALVCMIVSIASTEMSVGTAFSLNGGVYESYFTNHLHVTGDNPWNPEFLSEIDMYKTLRFVDWYGLDHFTRTSWWNPKRKLKSDTIQYSPVAFEWMIDLSNRVDADMWVSIPRHTINRNTGDSICDYAVRLAILLKHGVDMHTYKMNTFGDSSTWATKRAADWVTLGGKITTEPLNSNLKVYVEYSPLRDVISYCRAEGKAMHLDADTIIAGYKFYAWASIRVFRAFDLVFGVNSPRVVRVLPTETNDTLMAAIQMQMVKNAVYNSCGTKADAVAIAPYFVGSDTSLAAFVANIPVVTAKSRMARNFANGNDLKLVAYEGGHGWVPGVKFLSDSSLYDVYRIYLDSMNVLFDVFIHHHHVGGHTGSMLETGCGLRSFPYTPKYDALRDFIEAQQQVSIQTSQPRVAPVVIPRSTSGSYSILGRKTSGSIRQLTPGVYLAMPGLKPASVTVER